MDALRISDVQKLVERHRAAGAVVLMFDKSGKVSMTSYGETRQWCRAVGSVGDQLMDLITSGKVQPKENPKPPLKFPTEKRSYSDGD